MTMVHHISNSKAVADCVHVNHRVIIALPSSQANALATPQTTNKNTSIRRHLLIGGSFVIRCRSTVSYRALECKIR